MAVIARYVALSLVLVTAILYLAPLSSLHSDDSSNTHGLSHASLAAVLQWSRDAHGHVRLPVPKALLNAVRIWEGADRGDEGDLLVQQEPEPPPLPPSRRPRPAGGGGGGHGRGRSRERDGAARGAESASPASKFKLRFKPSPTPGPPVRDPFPLLSSPNGGHGRLKLPLKPPGPNDPKRRGTKSTKLPGEATPLFIGFTRNWPLLLQCVVSYIAAGWPAEDIYVVENTGVMRSNEQGNLTLQNPFYLNHTQLAMLGVNVIVTPTLLTFSQLQNFYVWTALQKGWPAFFWSHQDVVVFSYENITSTTNTDTNASGSSDTTDTSPMDHPPQTFHTLYERCLLVLRYLQQPTTPRWANHFFAYDHLTLTNVAAVLEVGGWDAHIPFYAADCDMYDRLLWAGFWQAETPAGIVFDVSTTFDDLAGLLRLPGVVASVRGLAEDDEDEEGETNDSLKGSDTDQDQQVLRTGETWDRLVALGARMQAHKQREAGVDRLSWQTLQRGGQGEPFYRDPDGFDRGIWLLVETGRQVFAEKWGHRGCDILDRGLKGQDAWRVEKDWDVDDEGEEGPGRATW